MKAILEVKHLVKKYGDFTAVKGISFDIKEGEIFSLLGPKWSRKDHHHFHALHALCPHQW